MNNMEETVNRNDKMNYVEVETTNKKTSKTTKETTTQTTNSDEVDHNSLETMVQKIAKMSFEFAGPHTTFHHQHFKMVSILTHYYEQNTHCLNSHAAPCEPRKAKSEANIITGEENAENNKGNSIWAHEGRICQPMKSNNVKEKTEKITSTQMHVMH